VGIGGNPPKTGSVIQSVTVTILTNTATVGEAFSTAPTVRTTPEDDGTFTYLWELQGEAAAGLSVSDPTISNPFISGTPTTAGTVTALCTVTDSMGNQKAAEGKITVSAAVEGTQKKSPQMVQSHYNAVKAPSDCKANTTKRKAKK